MNANPRRRAHLLLIAALSLVVLAPSILAQRRAAAPRKPTTTKPPPAQPTPVKVEPAQTTEGVRRAMIRWRGRAGVERYRLQVARDRDFRDIVFDRAVIGFEYQVELPTGDNFFWRVAPAAQEAAEYSTPEAVVLTNNAGAGASLMLRSPTDIGWQAFTGEVLRPQPAPLRGASATDVVAVNADGSIFALDGVNGSALWTARYKPNARRDDPPVRPTNVFTPIVVRLTDNDKANVVVAYDGGIRALEGESGRELWRMPLPGAALSGAVSDLDNDKVAAELAVVTDEPALYFIDARNGHGISKEKLDSALVGGPIPYLYGAERGVAVTLASGMLDVRRVDGSRYRAVKFDVPFTTPPLVFIGPNGAIIVIGTEHGLLYLNGEDLKPLGKITTPDDGPRGRLAAADLDHDGTPEIVAVMKSGKIVVIGVAGRITWSAAGAGDAYSSSFVDLNGDGVLDVIVPSEHAFAAGYNGRDGTLLWQVDEPKGSQTAYAGGGALRSLTIIGTGAARPLVVSGDLAHAGVRAVGLPDAAVKVAAQ
ncbi:MAG: PQQ-binding-like beta-propeller repeat protein [Pyrinomonadaceae bacterium]